MVLRRQLKSKQSQSSRSILKKKGICKMTRQNEMSLLMVGRCRSGRIIGFPFEVNSLGSLGELHVDELLDCLAITEAILIRDSEIARKSFEFDYALLLNDLIRSSENFDQVDVAMAKLSIHTSIDLVRHGQALLK
jgi:hypothetical protein